VEHHQVPLVAVGRDEQVQRLRLVDERGAVRGKLEQPALVDLERRLVNVLFLLGEESRCWTEPPRSRIEVYALFFDFSVRSFSRGS
jgi:hypothetical protein